MRSMTEGLSLFPDLSGRLNSYEWKKGKSFPIPNSPVKQPTERKLNV